MQLYNQCIYNLHQKQFQGMLDHVWSEAGHDYGQKIIAVL